MRPEFGKSRVGFVPFASSYRGSRAKNTPDTKGFLEPFAAMPAFSANCRYTHLGSGPFLITADANQQPPVARTNTGTVTN